jgi:phosphoribulokinase/uridine kinase
MNENIEVLINKKKYQFPKGIVLEEIAKNFQDTCKYPIVLAKIGNAIKELSVPLNKSCEIEFLDLTSREGNRAHIAGLTFVVVYAIRSLYGPNANIYVEHSLDKGIYIEPNFELTEAKLNQIKSEMQKVIDSNLSITKLTIDRFEAQRYFESIKDYPKAGVMKYNTNTYVTLYRMGNSYNYFYNMMPTSTGKLKDFDLTYINKKGLVLRFPTAYIKDKIKEYEHHPHMYDVFNEYRAWAKTIQIENSVDLNKMISSGSINDLIRMDETLQSNKLLEVARKISENKKIKMVLMAGPSSSGKTTTSRKLSMYLKSFGLKIRTISMDDYFVDSAQTPLGEDGKPDFECLEAVDLKLFDKQIEQLLNGEEVILPTFNFILGVKEYKEKAKMDKNEILVIEGIHGLDSNILTNIPRENKFKIYLSALTELNIDNHNRISTSDNRLLRRIIRDNRTRGYDVTKTLENWAKVRSGEEKYVFPYQDDADFTFNTGLIYEIGILKTYVEPLLYSVDDQSPQYEEAKRLIDFLRLFLPIPSDAVPQDSILREFIGNSCFNV